MVAAGGDRARRARPRDLGISYADPYRDERGWAFTGGRFTDEVNGFDFLEQAYDATDPDYDGRVSVPVLWDKEDGLIVSNESADIVAIFDEWAGGDLYPADKLRARSTSSTSGSTASSRTASTAPASPARRRPTTRRSAASSPRSSGSRRILQRPHATWPATRSPGRLAPAPTLLRFDAVYHTHFRCNGARLIEYPNLLRYTTDLYQQPHVAETFALDEIKRHYYTTHDELNPKRIIPAGPLDLGFTSA